MDFTLFIHKLGKLYYFMALNIFFMFIMFQSVSSLDPIPMHISVDIFISYLFSISPL